MPTQNFLYSGGDVNLQVSSFLADSAYINILDGAQGSITLNQATPNALLNLAFIGIGNAGPVFIDLGNAAGSFFSAYNLGNGSVLNLNTESRSSAARVQGISRDNRLTVFDGTGAAPADNHNVTALYATLVLNGDAGPTSTIVYDLGGNETWAGSGTLNYNVPAAATVPFQSIIYGGKNTGTFVIGNNTPTRSDGSSDAGDTINAIKATNTRDTVPAPSAASVQLLLNVAQPGATPPTYNYTVTQNSDAQVSIFQDQGKLTYTGQDSTLALNSTTGTVVSTLTLNDNNTLWNGSGASTISINGNNNVLNSAGSGSLTIMGNSTAPVGTNNLTIQGVGDVTGRLSYNQGNENVVISGTNNLLLDYVGAGTTDVDVAKYTPRGEFASFNIGFTTSSPFGNVIIRDFVSSSGLDPASQNVLLVNASTNVSAIYDGTDTVFTLTGGSTGQVTFTGINLSDKNPFVTSSSSAFASNATSAFHPNPFVFA